MPSWIRRQQWLADLQANAIARAIGTSTGQYVTRRPTPTTNRPQRPQIIPTIEEGAITGQVEISAMGRPFVRVTPGAFLDRVRKQRIG